MSEQIKTGIDLIQDERQRQLWKEHFTFSHDDTHVNGELAMAAACYCLAEDLRNDNNRNALPILRWWKFAADWWKPSPENRIKELVKAGAMIVAEIDRLERITLAEKSNRPPNRPATDGRQRA